MAFSPARGGRSRNLQDGLEGGGKQKSGDA